MHMYIEGVKNIEEVWEATDKFWKSSPLWKPFEESYWKERMPGTWNDLNDF